jgi:hypothetical protein
MSIFRRGEPFGSGRRFKIKITAEDGRVFWWHKRGRLHTVEEDVADTFVAHFNPQLFQVRPDGSLTPPAPGETLPIRRVEKEPA